jgi:carboxymethylenebutenolidase
VWPPSAASVLVQIGLLDPKALPVVGAETAHKAMDRTLPSNALMANWSGTAASRFDVDASW